MILSISCLCLYACFIHAINGHPPYGRLVTPLPVNRHMSNNNKKVAPHDEQHDVVDSLAPLYILVHIITASIIAEKQEIPEGYILVSKETNSSVDIGQSVAEDNWRRYLQQQPTLRVFVLVIVLLIILVPIAGLLYCFLCLRCRGDKPRSSACEICISVTLTILLILMLLSLIFALISNIKLRNRLEKPFSSRCAKMAKTDDAAKVLESTSQQLTNLYVRNYAQFQRKMDKMLKRKRKMIHTHLEHDAIDKMIRIVENLPEVLELLKQLKSEIIKARFLATQFRDGIRGVKRNLLFLLISHCGHIECKQFYQQHYISSLDLGCLHYDSLPNLDSIIEGLQLFIDSKFMDYPRSAKQQLQQMKTSIEQPLHKFLDAVRQTVNDGAQQLHLKNNISKRLLIRSARAMRPANPWMAPAKPPPYLRLHRKMGLWWYSSSLSTIVVPMLVPLLLLISIVLSYFSRKSSAYIIFAAIVLMFLLFSSVLLLALFYLVHGGLIHHANCNFLYIMSMLTKEINLNRALQEEADLPVIRLDEAMRKCEKNMSLYNTFNLSSVHSFDNFYNNIMEKVEKSVQQMENSSDKIVHNTGLYTEAADVVEQLLLQSQLSHEHGRNFAKHICKELVPEPLPDLSNNLDKLALSLPSDNTSKDNTLLPMLQNQAIHLRAFHEHLGEPLLVLVATMREQLQKINNLLTGKRGSFARYIKELLAEIKHYEEYMQNNATIETKGLAQNVSKYLDEGLREYISMVENVTEKNLTSCRPLALQSRKEIYLGDECKLIAKPMNAIWFGLLVCSLLFLPAICLAHQLRCMMRSRFYNDDSLIQVVEENYVHHMVLPVPLSAQPTRPATRRPLPRCDCSEFNIPRRVTYNYDYYQPFYQPPRRQHHYDYNQPFNQSPRRQHHYRVSIPSLSPYLERIFKELYKDQDEDSDSKPKRE